MTVDIGASVHSEECPSVPFAAPKVTTVPVLPRYLTVIFHRMHPVFDQLFYVRREYIKAMRIQFLRSLVTHPPAALGSTVSLSCVTGWFIYMHPNTTLHNSYN